jgi:hypothetical protein
MSVLKLLVAKFDKSGKYCVAQVIYIDEPMYMRDYLTSVIFNNLPDIDNIFVTENSIEESIPAKVWLDDYNDRCALDQWEQQGEQSSSFGIINSITKSGKTD